MIVHTEMIQLEASKGKYPIYVFPQDIVSLSIAYYGGTKVTLASREVYYVTDTIPRLKRLAEEARHAVRVS